MISLWLCDRCSCAPMVELRPVVDTMAWICASFASDARSRMSTRRAQHAILPPRSVAQLKLSKFTIVCSTPPGIASTSGSRYLVQSAKLITRTSYCGDFVRACRSGFVWFAKSRRGQIPARIIRISPHSGLAGRPPWVWPTITAKACAAAVSSARSVSGARKCRTLGTKPLSSTILRASGLLSAKTDRHFNPCTCTWTGRPSAETIPYRRSMIPSGKRIVLAYM
mmetsp:Transcript_13903/g.51900  ORF Transcript_13903/g.51900 Transcript_13903/m.51900 type:complete len:224 (+) Transcript_13903:1222-1893(+)